MIRGWSNSFFVNLKWLLFLVLVTNFFQTFAQENRQEYYHYYDSLKLLEGHKQDTNWYKANLNLVDFYFQDLQLDSAYPFLEEALSIAKQINNKSYLHNGKLYLITYYIYRSNLDTAKEIISETLNENPKEEIKGNFLSHLGVINYYQGNEFEALDNFLKALVLDEKYNPEELSNSYSNIANLYLRQNDLEKAQQYFHKALKIERQKGDSLNMMVSYHNLLLLHFDSENQDSINYYFKKFKEFRNYVDQDFYDDVLAYQTGHYYLSKGDTGMAIQFFDSTRSLALARNNAIPYINASSFQAKLLIQKGDLLTAEKIALSALDHAIKNGMISSRKYLYERLFEIEQKRGNYKKALSFYKQFKLFSDSANTKRNEKQLNRLKYLRQLTENQRLEQQNIKEKQKVEVANTKIQNKNLQLIFTVSLLIALAILILLLYKFYQRNKKNLEKLRKSEELLRVKSIELDDYNKKLIELNELKSKLMSLLAHDLRSPLVGVLSTLNLLKEEELDESEQKEIVEELYSSVHNNLNGLDNLVKWAQSQLEGLAIKPDPFPTKELWVELENELSTVYKNKGVTLRLEGATDIIMDADKEMLKSALRNLLTNALKFSPPSGKVVLKVIQTKEETQFLISDQGNGIPKEVQKDLFNKPLSSQKGTGGESGSGIGLLLVKEFITLNGGKVSFETKEGVGTTFKISIPKLMG